LGTFFSLKALLFAHSFNFTKLPGPIKTFIFARALRRIKHFVVFSTVEKELYARRFAIPIDRFDFVHWGVRPPIVAGPPPANAGNYVSAVGGNARDYRTLVAAAREMPDIPFILVVRPANLEGLTIPPNVKILADIPFGASMNVLRYSRFMVLPLINSEVPCGHVTLVAAMHLGRAIVVTESRGICDYARDGENALTVSAGRPASMIEAIRQLWNKPALCHELASNGQNFASRECSEERVSNHFRHWLAMQQFVADAKECAKRQLSREAPIRREP
jgi:glycosyltransferase involved in cell wall biosynthesis